MNDFVKKYLFGIIYGLLLLGFTVYAILDVFVIPHTYGVMKMTNVSENVIPFGDVKNGQDENGQDNIGQDESDILGNELTANNDDMNNNNSVSDDMLSQEAISDNSVLNSTSNNAVSDNASSSSNNLYSFNGPSLPSTIVDDSDFLQVGTYSDDNIGIVVNRYRYCETYVFVADVYISSPALFKTAFANDTYGRNINKKTTQIAADHGAILAVNGDFYGARQSGYVIRNGALFSNLPNPKNQDLVVYTDGSFGIFNEADFPAEDILNSGAWQVLAFGPALVNNSQIVVSEKQEVAHASYSNPRTAIGYIDAGHYQFVVSDGRTSISAGLSLYELATFMQSSGCKVAYNLDGGGSSTLVFQGQLLNNPCPGGDYIVERSVSDIVYIGY